MMKMKHCCLEVIIITQLITKNIYIYYYSSIRMLVNMLQNLILTLNQCTEEKKDLEDE